MTFWSLMFIAAAFLIFMFACTRLMACIRSKIKDYPFEEWKGYLVALVVSLVVLVGCLIAADITAVHCPNCKDLIVTHYCKRCDTYAVKLEVPCPDCGKQLSHGFCEFCGVLQN